MIKMLTSKERDREIARYLVETSRLCKPCHENTAAELSARAEGSAIWIRIAVQYLEAKRVADSSQLRALLAKLPSSKGLAELYWRLFQETSSEEPSNAESIQYALETLAIAFRPLQAEELAYAVILRNRDTDEVGTIREMDEEVEAEAKSLVKLIRPFVTASGPQTAGEPRLRLIHQSLRELVLYGTTDSWKSIGDGYGHRPTKNSLLERPLELNNLLLQCCIRYLLFDECGELDLASASQSRDTECSNRCMSSAIVEDEADMEGTGAMVTESSKVESIFFDPVKLELGHFFTYAASHWTDHFEELAKWHDRMERPTAAELVNLCRAGSLRLNNWVFQWNRPNCTHVAERYLDADQLDPLVVISNFWSCSVLGRFTTGRSFGPPRLPGRISLDSNQQPYRQGPHLQYQKPRGRRKDWADSARPRFILSCCPWLELGQLNREALQKRTGVG